MFEPSWPLKTGVERGAALGPIWKPAVGRQRTVGGRERATGRMAPEIGDEREKRASVLAE